MKLDNEQLRKNEYYMFGKELYGPFLYHYSEWLLQEIVKSNINKVFFLARDGFMMKKGFDRLAEKKNIRIENEYVYFSRKSIRTALLWEIDDYAESLKYMSAARYVSVGQILEYYGFSKNEFEHIASKHGLVVSKDISFAGLSSNEDIKVMYLAERDYIFENSKKQYDLIVKYLKQISFKGKVAIVDIGWRGSMQFYLEELARSCGIGVNICGFYIGIDALPDVSGATKGYIYSNNDMKYRKSTLCFFGIWERLFQSKEGSTLGYKQIDTAIQPIQDEYEYKNDEKLCGLIENIQQGALDCLNDTDKMCTAKKSKKNIIRFGKYPTQKEVQLFVGFYNMDGKNIYYLPQKSIFSYGLKEFVHDFSNSLWKTGFMKQAFKIPFPYYWIYAVLRR